MANIKFYRGKDASKGEGGNDGIVFTSDTKAIYVNNVKYGQNYDSSISTLTNKIENIVYVGSALPSTIYDSSIYFIV